MKPHDTLSERYGRTVFKTNRDTSYAVESDITNALIIEDNGGPAATLAQAVYDVTGIDEPGLATTEAEAKSYLDDIAAGREPIPDLVLLDDRLPDTRGGEVDHRGYDLAPAIKEVTGAYIIGTSSMDTTGASIDAYIDKNHNPFSGERGTSNELKEIIQNHYR
jgi:CheY-like chemotaxis protein